MEKVIFQQPPKYRQRRCILCRWWQTVPHARTGDTKCTVTYGSPSHARDVQSGRGRGSQPSAWLQDCHRLQLVSKVWWNSTMETTENEHCKFELNALRYRQPVQFHEQWRYELLLPFGVDQPSSGMQNRLKWMTLKPQSNRPLYSNRVIGTLATDGWAVTIGTARRGLGRLQPCPVPSSLYQM